MQVNLLFVVAGGAVKEGQSLLTTACGRPQMKGLSTAGCRISCLRRMSNWSWNSPGPWCCRRRRRVLVVGIVGRQE